MITIIPTTTTPTTIPTMAMVAATWCSGACIPGMAGVSDLSRCAADPAVFDGWKEMIWSGELKLRTGATRKIHAVLVHSAPRPLFLTPLAGTPPGGE
jgi:hypothetical protein